MARRVMVDFDGVLHRYSRGWHDGTCYDQPVPGALAFVTGLHQSGYEVVIHTTRDARQVRDWLETWAFPILDVTNAKLPAVAYVDDRAVAFQGDFSEARLGVDALVERGTWNKPARKEA